MDNTRFPYEDILHLPHPVSTTRAKMSMVERAAQFAPFAALTGYDATIAETARLTGQRIELDESEKAALDTKLQLLSQFCCPIVTVTHFVSDLHKEGGCYVKTTCCIRKIDSYNRRLILTDGHSIALDDILELNCEAE